MKENEINVNSKVIIREVKLRVQLDDHEYQSKLNYIIRFLGNNDHVKLSVMFRGRETSHPEPGERLLLRFVKDLENYATVELPPIMEGKQMSVMFTPKKDV